MNLNSMLKYVEPNKFEFIKTVQLFIHDYHILYNEIFMDIFYSNVITWCTLYTMYYVQDVYKRQALWCVAVRYYGVGIS